MSDTPKQTVFFPALEGLRGVAILTVLIYHNFPQSGLFFGWLGVDLFFVLSGFLITTILMNSINNVSTKSFFKNFYIRRTLRIFPLYYLFLFVLLFLLPAFGIFNNEVVDYREDKWWFIFYLQNWLFTNNFPETSRCLNHFWSLGVEEQFYVVWPLLIYFIRKPKQLLICLTSFLVVLFIFRSILWQASLEDFNYTNFYAFTRFDGIAIGSMVSLIVLIKKDFLLYHTATIVTSLAVLNFVFYFFNSAGQLPYLAFIGYTTFAAMFGILVYELTYGNSRLLKQIFSIRPLRFLGKISYGLYMFHWPVYYFLREFINGFFSGNFQTGALATQMLTSITTSAIAILLSLISYYSFEMYFLNLKKKFG
jgi:peptidoglycan/LPS O-acetylase OafA/YrhL